MMKFHQDAMPYVAGGAIFSILASVINSGLGVLSIVITCFMVYIFRDFNRILPEESEKKIIGPCDGVVIDISSEKVEDKEYTIVTIAKSLFNNAIVRCPCVGKVAEKTNSRSYKFSKYDGVVKGYYSTPITIKFETKEYEVYLVQSADVMLKKIISNVDESASCKVGQSIGLLFKGQVQLLFPENFVLNIKKGQTVVAGETVIGSLK